MGNVTKAVGRSPAFAPPGPNAAVEPPVLAELFDATSGLRGRINRLAHFALTAANACKVFADHVALAAEYVGARLGCPRAAAQGADILIGLHPLSHNQVLALFDLLRALIIELDHEYSEII